MEALASEVLREPQAPDQWRRLPGASARPGWRAQAAFLLARAPQQVALQAASLWALLPLATDVRYREGHHPRRSPTSGHRRSDPDAESRSEEHTSELQSLMRISNAVFCLKKKK